MKLVDVLIELFLIVAIVVIVNNLLQLGTSVSVSAIVITSDCG